MRLGGGVVLLALYLAAVRAGTVALDASAVVLIVVVGCFCIYTAASLRQADEEQAGGKGSKEEKESKKRLITRTESQKICGFSGFVFRLPAQSAIV